LLIWVSPAEFRIAHGEKSNQSFHRETDSDVESAPYHSQPFFSARTKLLRKTATEFIGLPPPPVLLFETDPRPIEQFTGVCPPVSPGRFLVTHDMLAIKLNEWIPRTDT